MAQAQAGSAIFDIACSPQWRSAVLLRDGFRPKRDFVVKNPAGDKSFQNSEVLHFRALSPIPETLKF
jgi:hypothetical protein